MLLAVSGRRFRLRPALEDSNRLGCAGSADGTYRQESGSGRSGLSRRVVLTFGERAFAPALDTRNELAGCRDRFDNARLGRLAEAGHHLLEAPSASSERSS